MIVSNLVRNFVFKIEKVIKNTRMLFLLKKIQGRLTMTQEEIIRNCEQFLTLSECLSSLNPYIKLIHKNKLCKRQPNRTYNI